MISLNISYETPRFGDLDVPPISTVQSGRALTIRPRRVEIDPAGRDGLRAYVEGRAISQKTGELGNNRGISFGSSRADEPLENAPDWLRELLARVEAFERLRTSASHVTDRSE